MCLARVAMQYFELQNNARQIIDFCDLNFKVSKLKSWVRILECMTLQKINETTVAK